ncbi:hypothetical protein ACOZGD_37615 [Streptomyces murinus]
MSEEDIPEPVQARPWRPQDGPWPKVTVYPATKRPVVQVWSGGQWHRGEVHARQTWRPSRAWPRGRLVYQVSADLTGDFRGRRLLSYEWPQPGLRAAETPDT